MKNTTNSGDVKTIRRCLIQNPGHIIVNDSSIKLLAGSNRIVASLVHHNPMDIFEVEPCAISTCAEIAPFWSITDNTSTSYLLLEISNHRGAGIHLLPLERLIQLHMLAGQVMAGHLTTSLFPREHKNLDELATRILALHVPDPLTNGLTLPEEHKQACKQLEVKYLHACEQTSGSLSHSTAPFCVFRDLHVAFPNSFGEKKHMLCPSSYLEVSLIPAKISSDKQFRVKIVNSELVYNDSHLAGNPCHGSEYGCSVFANLSGEKLFNIIDHFTRMLPEIIPVPIP